MTTNNDTIKIPVSEVAKVLGWHYQTTASIKNRKSPRSKYQTYLDCEKKLIEAKEKINKELTQK
jgi:hypothetical protein